MRKNQAQPPARQRNKNGVEGKPKTAEEVREQPIHQTGTSKNGSINNEN